MRIGALDFGGTAIKYGVWEAGQLTGLSERPSPTTCSKDVVEALTDIIGSLGKLDAVGISTRGQVDEHGAILYDNGPVEDYTGTPLKALLEERFGIPVWVENDVNAAAWGEACLGAGKGTGDFLCITYGTGIGGALVLNGQLYRGANWSAGEFGAMQMFSQNPAWEGFGGAYYENYASATALVSAAKSVDPVITDGKVLCARMKDVPIAPLVDQWIEHVSLGLSTLIHIFNPGLIVLGGGILQNEELFRRIDACTRTQLMPGFEVVQLKQAQLGNRAGMIGAALLAEQML